MARPDLNPVYIGNDDLVVGNFSGIYSLKTMSLLSKHEQLVSIVE